ncbi:AraC family transcriptional regulator [Kalymmatonema gypsitolerans NIES-4073]|nr:AraC family transcriptional regulator [Scytonema sp. NIES-4073]
MQAPVTPSIKTVDLPKNRLYPPICSSAAYGWKNILAEEFCQPPGQEKYQSSTEHTICLSLNHRPSRLLQVMGGLPPAQYALCNRRHIGLAAKGDICIVPAGVPFFYQWDREDQFLPKLRGSVKAPEEQARSAVLRAFSQGMKRDGRRF